MMRTGWFKDFDWLAVVFYPLAVILMEAFWVAPWLNWIGYWPFFQQQRPALSLVSVIIVLVLSLIITRVFLKKEWPLWKIQSIIIGSGLVTMLLVLAVEYNDGYTFLSGGWFSHTGQMLGNTFSNAGTISIALPVIVYLWWRGIKLGQSTSYFRDIYRSFLIGMVALIALIIFWQISSSSESIPPPGSEIGINIIAFFFFGLLAIAICHLYNMRRTMPKEDAKLTSVWRWLPVMLGVIGLMILIGFGIASAISPDFIDTIGRGASAVWDFLGKVLEYIMIPFIYIGQGIAIAMRWLFSLFRGEQQELEEPEGFVPGPQDESIISGELSPTVTSVIKWVVLAIIIGVVIFFLARAIIRGRGRRAKEDFDEIRESLFSWRALRDDLKEFFRSMRRKPKPAIEQPYVYDEDAEGRLDIREIYRHMQWEAGRSGILRHRHETTGEYAKRIEHIAPTSSLPVGKLTDMYEHVRYGEEIASVHKESSANNLWHNLREILRRLRGL